MAARAPRSDEPDREAAPYNSCAPSGVRYAKTIFSGGEKPGSKAPLVSNRPKPVSVRPSTEEDAAWRAWAARRSLSLSDLIRRTMAEALELEAACGRADRDVVRRVARL